MTSFLVALQFLTILPLPMRPRLDGGALARAQTAFPLVGAFLGIVLLGLDQLLGLVAPRQIVDALLVATLAILTGGLHLDGLIDSCDGLFAPRGREERLAIMRDSHAGSFGVIGAVIVLLLKYAALSSLEGESRVMGLFLAPTLSRWGMVCTLNAFRYARASGKGSAFVGGGRWPAVAATIIAAALSAGVWQLRGLAMLLLVALWVALAGRFIAARVGGLTGDSYGAINETSEALVLMGAATALGISP